jgi:hypothetical protein
MPVPLGAAMPVPEGIGVAVLVCVERAVCEPNAGSFALGGEQMPVP